MRLALAALLAFAAFVPASADSAIADEYAWCANYSGRLSGRNCWFKTLEQCRATVSGVGGYCEPSPWYTGRATTPSPRRHRR